MRWPSRRGYGSALLGAVLAASVPVAPTAAESTVPVEVVPSLAAKLWRVGTVQEDGRTRCDVTMSGRNKEAGGAYTVHMISDDAHPTLIIIEHDGDDVAARDATFLMNGSFKLLTLDILQRSYDRHRRGIYMQLGRDAYTEDFLSQIEYPQSRSIDIRIGKRSFGTVVQGFKVISDTLRECERSLGSSKEQPPTPTAEGAKPTPEAPTNGAGRH